MKLSNLFLGICVATTAGAAVAAPVIVDGGTVHFTGNIVNAACAVSSESENQTVTLGQVKTTTLAADGDTSTAVGFNIILEDCDSAVSSKASISFSGPTVVSKTKILAIDGSASSDARNVGIQVVDDTGVAVDFTNNQFSTPKTLVDGRNVLPFQARYISVGGNTTAGRANAQATFKVQYE